MTRVSHDAAVSVDVALAAAYRRVSKGILAPLAGYAIERAGAATDWGNEELYGADGGEP
jgi:hypothetical protein